jgi:hypothetical protein
MRNDLKLGVLAGLAGAGAEIAWISLYAAVSGADAGEVARGVAIAASGGLMDWALAGVVIHMLLGAALGIALALAWRRIPARLGAAPAFGLVLLTLAAVWKINFFVLLPLINPAFANMLPYAVTLTSKLLFALAAATALGYGGARMRAPLLPAAEPLFRATE